MPKNKSIVKEIMPTLKGEVMKALMFNPVINDKVINSSIRRVSQAVVNIVLEKNQLKLNNEQKIALEENIYDQMEAVVRGMFDQIEESRLIEYKRYSLDEAKSLDMVVLDLGDIDGKRFVKDIIDNAVFSKSKDEKEFYKELQPSRTQEISASIKEKHLEKLDPISIKSLSEPKKTVDIMRVLGEAIQTVRSEIKGKDSLKEPKEKRSHMDALVKKRKKEKGEVKELTI